MYNSADGVTNHGDMGTFSKPWHQIDQPTWRSRPLSLRNCAKLTRQRHGRNLYYKRLSTYSRRIDDTVNKGRAWKTPPCICSYQLFIKSEVCYSNCWKLQRLLEAVMSCRRGSQYDWKCSFYFNCYFFLLLQQTEISDKKLFIFQHGEERREFGKK